MALLFKKCSKKCAQPKYVNVILLISIHTITILPYLEDATSEDHALLYLALQQITQYVSLPMIQ